MTTKTVRRHITLPRELAEEFESVVGERNQSAVIAELIEERLKRERLRVAFAALADAPKEPHPEWEGPGAVAEWVTKERASWDRGTGREDE